MTQPVLSVDGPVISTDQKVGGFIDHQNLHLSGHSKFIPDTQLKAIDFECSRDNRDYT